ncbi:MAG TPA: bifunctional DNA-formamidopyrimidine glycosylase/DNA-(apurinic or apyrimidinic site) lyase [Vicinamibacterales bacterium]
MPELPEVEAVRRMLERATRGARIDRVELRRPDLRRPFPPDFVSRLTGQTITSVSRRGKYLLATLGSGDTLLVHLGMSGAFRAERPRRALRAERPHSSSPPSRPVDPHDHVVIVLSSGVVVTFNDPRRFGLMDLIQEHDDHEALRSMGPEPLDDAFDAMVLARACAGKRVALKVLLLDQRLVAGVGNIYASEALHHAGLSPRRRASTLATVAGRPRPAAFKLAAGIKAVLHKAVAANARAYSSGRFRVYEREGKPCPRRGCGGTIRRITQAGRSTYFCPVCQK